MSESPFSSVASALTAFPEWNDLLLDVVSQPPEVVERFVRALLEVGRVHEALSVLSVVDCGCNDDLMTGIILNADNTRDFMLALSTCSTSHPFDMLITYISAHNDPSALHELEDVEVGRRLSEALDLRMSVHGFHVGVNCVFTLEAPCAEDSPLRPMQEVYRRHIGEVEDDPDEDTPFERACDLIDYDMTIEDAHEIARLLQEVNTEAMTYYILDIVDVFEPDMRSVIAKAVGVPTHRSPQPVSPALWRKETLGDLIKALSSVHTEEEACAYGVRLRAVGDESVRMSALTYMESEKPTLYPFTVSVCIQ